MSFIVLFALSWAAFYLFIDFERLQELFPAALIASLLGAITDLMMLQYKLWGYDTKLVSARYIPLLLDISVYPVAAILFSQYFPLQRRKVIKLLYVVVWSLPAILLEWTFMYRGEMNHYKWWTLWHSFFADMLIFSIVIMGYLVYRPYILSGKTGEVRR